MKDGEVGVRGLLLEGGVRGLVGLGDRPRWVNSGTFDAEESIWMGFEVVT